MSQTRITIRPLRSGDASDIYEIMHMPNVLWGTRVLPSTTADAWSTMVAQWVGDEHMHVFVAELQEHARGMVSVHVGRGRASHVGDIAMAVHDKHQRQGIGKMLLITALDLADNWLNLARLQLDVYADNEHAIRLYQQFDFSIEGRKRGSAFRGGAYIDSLLMARLRLPGGATDATATHAYTETLTRTKEAQDN